MFQNEELAKNNPKNKFYSKESNVPFLTHKLAIKEELLAPCD